MIWMSEVSSFWTRFSNHVLEAVYPSRCALCDVGETPLCFNCLQEMEPNPIVFEREGPLDFSRRIFAYRGRAAQAVRSLKYERETSLAYPMAEIIAKEAQALHLGDDAVALPVPIHWTRHFERGYNQSELLCRSLPCRIEREWLVRTRASKPQAFRTSAERRESMDGLFEAASAVQGQRILLVDDVITTGETARACAAALKRAGALDVGVIAFAGNP